ncbi:hypothetical protein GLX27_002001 [Malassezia furfur]|uniref:Uncharacterized protein n=1 Tax=Malassezia furfur TaxID=55194 RepID=A0ABY8EP56_MALFU|nr:hypothetical protein GLX27_002001 [Malassezia furfur]
MPQATLEFPPVYTVVGVYRLFHDPKLWHSIWEASRHSMARAGMMAGLWVVLSLPFQGFFSSLFVHRVGTAVGAEHAYNFLAGYARSMHIPMLSFHALAKLLFILNQVSFVFEMNLKTQLRHFRRTAYADTVASRGKPADWWTPYTEEWQKPPAPKSSNAPRRGLSERLKQSVIRWVMRKVIMIFTTSIPLFGVVVYAGFSALDYAVRLQSPLFDAKHMTPQQVEVWVEERRTSYWLFGFFAMLLERVPILGMAFSISNRIGAAMWAHDLEKRQQRFQTGELHPLSELETKRAPRIPQDGEPGSYGHPARADVDLPGDFMARPSGSSTVTNRGASRT